LNISSLFSNYITHSGLPQELRQPRHALPNPKSTTNFARGCRRIVQRRRFPFSD
jgi:hypothetical protein